jgi:hypothetical protein
MFPTQEHKQSKHFRFCACADEPIHTHHRPQKKTLVTMIDGGKLYKYVRARPLRLLGVSVQAHVVLVAVVSFDKLRA